MAAGAAGPAFAQTSQAVQQGNAVLHIYLDTCVKYMGRNAEVTRFAIDNHFVRADEKFSKAALQGKAGEVWGVPNPVGQFLIVLTGESQCAAWARTADVKTVNTGFEKLVKGLPRPGLLVKPYVDRVLPGSGGNYRQLGYFVQKEGAASGLMLISTTSEAAAAEVQVRLTAGLASQ